MGTEMESMDAGRDHDEVLALLSRADESARAAMQLARRFHDAATSMRYPDNAIGADARRVVEGHLGNRMGQLQSIVSRLDGLIAKTRSSIQVQDEHDSAAAEGIAEIGRGL